MLQNKPLLFSIIAILAGLRFLVWPYLDYADAQHQRLLTLTEREVKSSALLEQKATLENVLHQQHIKTERLLKDIPVTHDTQAYRLGLQTGLQQLAAQQGSQLVFFDWLGETDLAAFDVHRARINIRLKGRISNIVLTHAAIEQQFLHLSVISLTGNWRGELGRASEVELTMVLEADYRLGGSNEVD